MKKIDTVLEGKRVVLKLAIASDADEIYLSWLNDDRVIAGLETVSKPYPMELLKEYIEKVINDERTYMFMVFDRERKKKIGTAKIHNIHPVNKTCNLGMMIGDVDFWGKGYGNEIYSLVIEYAFTALGVRKISEAANATNVPSLAMCKKAGFKEEGVLKEQVLSDGKFVDKILLALFAKDWKK